MLPRSRTITARILAGLALTSAAFALPASCAGPQTTSPAELVGEIAESTSSLRDAFDEHREWYGHVELDAALPKLEAEEARRIHSEVSELIGALYALDACQKEGWSRETVFISDLVGQLDAAIDAHVRNVAKAESQLELTVEEGIYAIEVTDILDGLDDHIEAAKGEAEQRPSMRCGRAPARSTLRRRVPLI